MREVTSHKVNGLNDKLQIEVLDEPGSGGASHHAMTDQSELTCDLCGDQGPLLLQSKCHLTAPLQATVDGNTLTLRCYLPECQREVVRFAIADPAELTRLREQVARQTATINAMAETCGKYGNQLNEANVFLATYDAKQAAKKPGEQK